MQVKKWLIIVLIGLMFINLIFSVFIIKECSFIYFHLVKQNKIKDRPFVLRIIISALGGLYSNFKYILLITIAIILLKSIYLYNIQNTYKLIIIPITILLFQFISLIILIPQIHSLIKFIKGN